VRPDREDAGLVAVVGLGLAERIVGLGEVTLQEMDPRLGVAGAPVTAVQVWYRIAAAIR
jgi:hypothetical protein